MTTSERNQYDNNDPGAMLADMLRRIERLEAEDGLTDTHPVTGSEDFLGTVLTTPEGVPVQIVSQEHGLEMPALTIPARPLVTPPALGIGEWKDQFVFDLPYTIADAVRVTFRREDFVSVTPSVAAARLQSFDSNGTLVATSDPLPWDSVLGSIGNTFTEEFNWEHGVPLSNDPMSLVLSTAVTAGAVQLQPSVDTTAAYTGGSPVLGASPQGI